MVLLDHLTRGRAMLGVGPGALPTDAEMIGLDPTETRPLLEEGMDVIMRLLRTDDPVTSKTSTWDMQRRPAPPPGPYSDPLFDVAVAAGGLTVGPYAWPASTASVCCRSVRRSPRASTCSASTGT